MDRDAVAILTPAQRECLRLVQVHGTSKRISQALNLSSHTVYMHIRAAMKKLDAKSRFDAAKVLAAAEGNLHQNLAHQVPEVPNTVENASPTVLPGTQIPLAILPVGGEHGSIGNARVLASIVDIAVSSIIGLAGLIATLRATGEFFAR